MKDFITSVPIKVHEHTNPDGSKIMIRSLDIGNRSFWDELTQEWIKTESDKGKARLAELNKE